MNDQDCLERAMFAASESYSHTAYDFGDCGREEDVNMDKELLDAKDPMIPAQKAA